MNPIDSVKTLIDQSKDYLDTKIELTRLKTIDKSSEILSSTIVMVFMLFFISLVIIFVSIALALLLGIWLGAYHYGFFIMAGFYALLLLIIYIQREKWIKVPIANGLINKMLK